MFFKRKSKNRDAVQRPADPRVVDVRVTAIEPMQADIRQTLDVGVEDDFRKAAQYDYEDRGDEVERDDGEGPSLFRPRFRTPMAVLKVFDDNQKTGEMIRMRGERIVIGRDEGDVIICHDKLMSGRHAEIIRRHVDGEYAWLLYDLQSRNGSFVKIDFIRLRAGDELILGTATYAFEESRQSAPRFVEVGSRQPRQVKFEQEEFWIGQDQNQCVSSLAEDHLLEARHAKVHYSKGRWCVAATSSRNEIWARIDQVELSNGTKFQLGEQRFQILMP